MGYCSVGTVTSCMHYSAQSCCVTALHLDYIVPPSHIKYKTLMAVAQTSAGLGLL